MSVTRETRRLIVALLLTLAALGCQRQRSTTSPPPPAPSAANEPTLRAGLRRSAYGLRQRNGDDRWWIDRAQRFAAAMGARPVIVQIVSTYQDDGATQFGFARPAGYGGSTERMRFAAGSLDHERALSAYDRAGVAAIIQIEPGDANVPDCLQVVADAFARHPCVIGYGVDAEWYRTKQSPHGRGQPVSDEDAGCWTAKVATLLPGGTLFLKHWSPRHMPPTFRDRRLWLLSDSQGYTSQRELLADFAAWARSAGDANTGYQIGYPRDRVWWSQLSDPPVALGSAILERIASCRWLIWVDFTADAAFPATIPQVAAPAQ